MNRFHRRAGLALLVAALLAAGGYMFVRSRGPQPIRPPKAGAAREVVAPARGAVGVAPALSPEALRERVKGANVVICILDAARADHFGAYGYPRETTPNFDALAKEGVVFEQHFAQYPQTSPSTATLFTGQYPDTHGVAVPRTGDPHERLTGLNPFAFTIDRAMGRAGFHTLLFTSTPAAAPVLNLGANFQVLFSPLGQVRSKEEDAQWRSPENLMGLIRGNLKADRRFFAYIHFLPPHNPYEMPQELRDVFAGQEAPGYFEAAPAFTKVYERFHDQDPPATGSDWVNLYDANLRWGDRALGELVSYLKEIGAYDSTLLIVTADHGEALGEHRYQWHATCPYDEAIHIPLVVKLPGKEGPVGRVAALTETIDVMPTVLDLVGAEPPGKTVQGSSLLSLLAGGTKGPHEYIFCRTNGEWPCYVVRNERWSLLLYQGGKMQALYDLEADPRETRNVIREHTKEATELKGVFAKFAQEQAFRPLDFLDPSFKPLTAPASAGMEIPEEAKRKLRTLGYLE